MPPSGKLLAEWFWTDRWMGSSAFMLPMEVRGLYREMMTQAWRRQARLPNNHEAIRRATGCTLEEWERCWPLVRGYWREENGHLVNDTQLDVYAEAEGFQQRAHNRGKNGGAASGRARRNSNSSSTQVQPELKPPSPSPSLCVLEKQEHIPSAGALAAFVESFWQPYPKKKSRADAEKAWRKLAPSPELCQRIYAAVVAQSGTADWNKDDGQYVPYPATWLNKRRWEDDVCSSRIAVSGPAVEWFEECQTLHSGLCGGRWNHAQRKQIDAIKESA
jgi:uncharacterized protein YdaU (DUF1376 family)